MTTTFHVDGQAGKMAVYNGTNRAALDNPSANLSLLKLHSDLDYPKIISVQTGSTTFPSITANTRRNATSTLFAHGRPGIPWVLGKLTVGGVTFAWSGSVPIQVDDAAAGYGGFPRTIALGADGTNVLVHENGISRNSGAVLGAITIDWTVYVTDVLP